ncbi:Hypothetical predicted protein [Octopus vulgaris]|uniref:Uncharacterized protein n=1 Tax=Octopus vulgaris TaxID=6645 RepID=A0AA36AH83_OCTVU|nr:Hypothetical predicted protein [Octopus vulgaris]
MHYFRVDKFSSEVTLDPCFDVTRYIVGASTASAEDVTMDEYITAISRQSPFTRDTTIFLHTVMKRKRSDIC